MSKVLVLNASYEPLNITSWRRAIVLVIKGKAEQVEHNDRFIYPNMPLPTVIRLRNYVRVPYKEIPLTRRNILQRDDHTCQYCGHPVRPPCRYAIPPGDPTVAFTLKLLAKSKVAPMPNGKSMSLAFNSASAGLSNCGGRQSCWLHRSAVDAGAVSPSF